MKTPSVRIFSALTLVLLLLGSVTACADRPMSDTHTEKQGSSSGGSGGMGGSSGGGGGGY
jgi:uncharacterized membrane protein